MKQYNCSNSDIDLACEEAGKFLASSGVERREALRITLTVEEALLQYQEKFGVDAIFRLRLVKRLSSIRVELIVPGESYDALGNNGEEADVIRGLLAGIGLAPSWSYKNGRNHIIFTPKKKPLSGTVKMVTAIVLAVITGILLNLLPEDIRIGVNNLLLTPLSNAFTGLISAVSGPLIFLSVLGSICSMGNLETLGKIGSKTIKVILLYMTINGAFMTVVGSLFYDIKMGGSGAADFSQVLDLIYGIIPTNLFEPFVTGNALQLIFISTIVGLAMVVLSSRVNYVFSLVEQLNSIVQTIMSVLTSVLPVLIFMLFTGMISSGNLSVIFASWKMVVVVVVMCVAYYAVYLIRTSFVKRISPALLFRKVWPTLAIALTTASSAAAFATNIHDANKKLGIDKKLVEFGIPIGQVLFMPGFFALLLGMVLGFAESCGITITLSWLVIAFLTNLLLSFALPPVPGGAMMGFTIAFAQLGIPMEIMGVALVVNAILDFPATACNVSSWQVTLIDVADSLNMLDKRIFYRD